MTGLFVNPAWAWCIDIHARKSWTQARLLSNIQYGPKVSPGLHAAKYRQSLRDEETARQHMGSWI